MKTRKAVSKRFRLSGTKKLIHGKVNMSHLLEHESSRVKRQRRGGSVIAKENETRIKKMLLT